MRFHRLLLGIMALGTASLAQGAIMYQYITESDNYIAESDGKAHVKVYLKETTSHTSLITSQNGLFGAGFTIEWVSGTGVRMDAGTATPGSGLEGVTDVMPSGVTAHGVYYTTSFSTGAPVVDGRVHIATVRFSADAGSTALFEVHEYVPGSTITFEDSLDLDFSGTEPAEYTGAGQAVPFQFTVGVPEPMCVGWVALAAVGVLCRVRCFNG